MDVSSHVECVCLLDKKKPEDYVEIDVDAEDTYYALTAYHVIDHNEIDHFAVITPEDPTVFEYKKEHPGSGQEEYYDRLPRAQIVYKAEESDLAVISFQSDKQLSVVPVSDIIAAKGDRNQYRRRKRYIRAISSWRYDSRRSD